MSQRALISTEELATHLDDPEWAIVDCRFDLTQPQRGRQAYLEAHIPGAVYAHLDEDLAAPHLPGKTGRHPLPPPERLAATLSTWGIAPGVQVVVYDDFSSVYAGRLWWMLRWLGHNAVSVLDGDWRKWQREGRPVRTGAEQRSPRTFVPAPRPEMVADAAELQTRLHDPSLCLLDARTFERYQGQNETLDPIAGHIPGARSAPNANNLNPDGTWKSPEVLRARMDALLDGATPGQSVVYCGSGVSAAHLLIAMEQAGLQGTRLYPGSWSDWITDPSRPIATDAESQPQ